MYALIMLVQSGSTDEGSSLLRVVTNLPHDPATIFIYILLAATFGSIFWFGRPGRGGTQKGGDA